MSVRWWSPLIAVALAGCDPGRLENPVRFLPCTLDVERDIFVSKCGYTAGCHSADNPQDGLDLVSSGVAARLTTATSTACGNRPMLSYLVEKSTAKTPSCGLPMPIVEPLTDVEVKCLDEYVSRIADGGT